MTNGTKVKKRNGAIEPLNLEKMHVMVELACKNLAGVSASQVEIQSGIQFYDGISTGEIQEILIRSASDLIDLDHPNYQYVAMCGSDLDIRSFGWSDCIYVYDNEPRNREIVNRIDKTINGGYKVVIWPKSIVEKDINDMVLGGHKIMSVLESNTYSGLQAKVKFNNWKKI